MAEYDVKRGHWKNVDLDAMFEEHFDSFEKETGADGEWYVGKGPAIPSFRVCLKDKATAIVEIEADINAPPEDQMGAIRLKNKVLEELTGFTAKQRAKRAQEKAKKAA